MSFVLLYFDDNGYSVGIWSMNKKFGLEREKRKDKVRKMRIILLMTVMVTGHKTLYTYYVRFNIIMLIIRNESSW